MNWTALNIAIAIPVLVVVVLYCLGTIFAATWGFRWITPETNCGKCGYERPSPAPERCPECGTFYEHVLMDTPQRRAERVMGMGRCKVAMFVLSAMVLVGVYFAVARLTGADERYDVRVDRTAAVVHARNCPTIGDDVQWGYSFAVQASYRSDAQGRVLNGEMTCRLRYKDRSYFSRPCDIPLRLRAPANTSGPSEFGDEEIRSLFLRAGLEQVLGDLTPHVTNARDLAYQVGAAPSYAPAAPIRLPCVVVNGSGGMSCHRAPVYGWVWFGLVVFALTLLALGGALVSRINRIRDRDLTRLEQRAHDYQSQQERLVR